MWTNTHPTEWARIYFVLTNALPISIAGVGDLEAKVRALEFCRINLFIQSR
jgi:hypothetical protein